jgi:hypothetical protein
MKAAIIDHTVSFIERKEREERVIQAAGLTNASSVVGRLNVVRREFLSSSDENRSGHGRYCLAGFTHDSRAEGTLRVD